ncbi:MAG: biopolymer transporter ExbD [Candidatus Krumholzibacteria bacterium]|nr:biopolymer transporter ExbD [Candidatus Krumholzibacteria bacterium]
MKKKSAFQTESRTTVVPIINVSLVVVLTLMMISPFLAGQETDVDLPTAKTAEVDDTDNVEITFTIEREIWVGEDQLEMSDVQHYLGILFADMPGAIAVVKADRNLPYGEVETLIAEVEASDASRIALATREKEQGGS